MAYQWPEAMSRIKLSYRSLIVLNDISSWAIEKNFASKHELRELACN